MSATEDTPGASRKDALLAFALALVPLALFARMFNFVCDDAFISFRYARNFAEGHGLRFNLGVEPPVEGYSNLLWVLFCSVPEALSLDTGIWARVASVLCSVALLALVVRVLARRIGVERGWLLLSAVAFAALPAVGMWSTSGLETMAFALSLFAGYERLRAADGRSRWLQAGVWFVAAVLLRGDGPLGVALVLLGVLLGALLERRFDVVRGSIAAGVIVAIGIGAHVLWRHGYYGETLPNTAKVKVAFGAPVLERGLDYVASYFLNFPVIAVGLVSGLVQLLRKPSAPVVEALTVVLGFVAYSIYVGGDFLPMGRFLLPAVPFVAVLIGCSLAPSAGSAGRAVVAGVVLLASAASTLPAFDAGPAPRSVRAQFHYNWNFPEYVSELELWRGEVNRADYWTDLGRALESIAQPGDSLVSDSVGAIGYYSKLFIYDQYGLTSREVAARPPATDRRYSAGHEKYVPTSYFEKDRPTFMEARFVDVDANGERVQNPNRPRRKRRYVDEIFALPQELGLPAGKALLVSRLP